jgi:ribosomal protein S27E
VPTLYVKCRACGSEIPSPIGEAKESTSDVIISSLRIKCPSCGVDDSYSTADFHQPVSPTDSLPAGEAMAEPSLTSEHAAHLEQGQVKMVGYAVVPPEKRSPHEHET